MLPSMSDQGPDQDGETDQQERARAHDVSPCQDSNPLNPFKGEGRSPGEAGRLAVPRL